jgi:hypothetical protein
MNGAQTDLFAGAPSAERVAQPVVNAPAPAVSAEVSVEVAPSLSPSATPETSSVELPSSTPAPTSHTSSMVPVTAASPIAQSISVLANIQSSSSSSTANPAPSSSAVSASSGRCRRRKRRSMDVQRHHARAAGLRNRTIGVRHITALAH